MQTDSFQPIKRRIACLYTIVDNGQVCLLSTTKKGTETAKFDKE